MAAGRQRTVASRPAADSAVVANHPRLGTFGNPAYGCLGGTGIGGLQLDALVAAWCAKQEVHVLVTAVLRSPDANLDAGKVCPAQLLNDGLQTMLPSGGTIGAQAHLPT